ncbi:MAG TPA: universal stress protein [Microbacterium sp.]|nr:universal stress protein [Microbacterium sp.]
MTAQRYVVGYTATESGDDALALGARLARATGAELDIVLVLPEEGRGAAVPPDAGYEAFLRSRAEGWLAAGAAKVPQAVPRSVHVRFGESFAEGLVAAAAEFGASLIVVGAAGGSRRGRYGLGSVANELLHSSDVPVVLAPAGAREVDGPVSRVTAMIGTRPGAEVLLDESVALASAADAELRLVSLVTVDLPAGVDTGVIRIAGAAHADGVLAEARAALPDGSSAEASVARGESIEDAVAHLDWQPGELVLVGSSRLAQRRRLFLGSTAAKMLRELPVPMIVVPRTRAQEGAQR